MNTLPVPIPLAVVILDGWGISFLKDGNAVAAAKTPTLDMITRHYPSAALHAAGQEVGLPWGEVGNSETGHSNIGAGQVRYQTLPQIDQAIADKSFFSNETIVGAISHAEKNKSDLHIMGLLGFGGVHSHSNHLFALLELVAKSKLRERTFVHIFTDGRDTEPQSALQYISELEQKIGKFAAGRIASLTGRLYAMDRNNNWDRTEQTYNMLVGGPRGAGASTPEQAMQQWYKEDGTDETLPPTAITKGGAPIAEIKSNDAVFFFNFRPDRARQITRAFVDAEFVEFKRSGISNLYFGTMTQYAEDINAPAAFASQVIAWPLARIISEQNLSQLHITETEKYAHLTYYLNGGREAPFNGEARVLIESSDTRNFAEVPAMAAAQITERVVEELEQGSFHIYFINYANADMLGHTGNLEAATKACAVVDEQIKKLYETIIPIGGAMLITADHGNAEEMLSAKTGATQTDHSSNHVPFYYVNSKLKRTTARSASEVQEIMSSPIGVLADVAPTVLDILHLEKIPAMTGISLLDSLQ